MEWIFLKDAAALDEWISAFVWHDAFIQNVKMFLPVYADGDGVVGEGARPSVSVIVSDGDGKAWEFLFIGVTEQNLTAQSSLDNSYAAMNAPGNEVLWHWGGEYIRAETVCCRERPPEVLSYRDSYSYRNLYLENGDIDLAGYRDFTDKG